MLNPYDESAYLLRPRSTDTPAEEDLPLSGTHRVKQTSTGKTLYLPTPHLSPTQVEMYTKCPRQYYFRYVLGHKRPPGVAQVEGTSHHEALCLTNTHQIAQHEPLPLPAVVEKFEDDFSDRSKEIEDWEGETKDNVITRGRNLLATYMKFEAPKITPEASEMEWHVDIDGIPYMGYIDLIDASVNAVLDYKICGARSPYLRDGAADRSVQLASYAMAVGRPRVGYIALVKDRVKIERRLVEKNDRQLQGLRERVLLVANAISAGSFPLCAPDSWACSPKYCGYYADCVGRYE